MIRFVLKVLVTSAFLFSTASVLANEVEPIYGNQLMTQEERLTHQQAMRNAKTPEAKALIRQRHHEKMRLRAKEKGLPFPEEPPMKRGNVNQKDRAVTGYGRGH